MPFGLTTENLRPSQLRNFNTVGSWLRYNEMFGLGRTLGAYFGRFPRRYTTALELGKTELNVMILSGEIFKQKEIYRRLRVGQVSC